MLGRKDYSASTSLVPSAAPFPLQQLHGQMEGKQFLQPLGLLINFSPQLKSAFCEENMAVMSFPEDTSPADESEEWSMLLSSHHHIY